MKTKYSTFILILFLTFIASSGLAQNKKYRKYLINGSAMLVSGMLDGTVESLTWHYDQGFKRRFPKANDAYWNPNVSWKYKYKNGNSLEGPKFPGSTTAFAFATDGYHLLRTCNRAVNTLVIVDYTDGCRKSKLARKEKWKKAGKDFLIYTAIRSIGFTLTYGVLFKRDPNYHHPTN